MNNNENIHLKQIESFSKFFLFVNTMSLTLLKDLYTNLMYHVETELERFSKMSYLVFDNLTLLGSNI